MKEIHKPRLTANMVMVTNANGIPAPSDKITTTELNMLNNIRTNVQTQLDNKQATVSGVTSTEIGYLSGLTSNVQTQIDGKVSSGTFTTHTGNTTLHITANERTTWNGKQAAITGAATTITGSNLTASRALISNGSGKVAVSDVTSTELSYLDGVSSNIQTQLNGKAASSHSHSNYAPLASPTLTGTPKAPTASADTNTTQIATTAFVKTAVTNGQSYGWMPDYSAPVELEFAQSNSKVTVPCAALGLIEANTPMPGDLYVVYVDGFPVVRIPIYNKVNDAQNTNVSGTFLIPKGSTVEVSWKTQRPSIVRYFPMKLVQMT